MYSMSMKMYANMAHMQYHLRCHFTAILQVGEHKHISSYRIDELIMSLTSIQMLTYNPEKLINLRH